MADYALAWGTQTLYLEASKTGAFFYTYVETYRAVLSKMKKEETYHDE